ncbi:hypothetical protein JOC36_001161 [Weissella uvarum]|uniref:bacteriocin immunity protein n=1 Tax=Weissella uvarum TaxID=1479233 RepID=UPI001960D9C6|nr:bacteriocin immunity protein [Weissella uvarum]MBM7617599.1 hypothetical protein [Weissella uvarum]MCM0595950.1 bacteriocin immunity protein [Weissella uvarum]
MFGFKNKKIAEIKEIVDTLYKHTSDISNPYAYRVISAAKNDLDHHRQAAPIVATMLANSFYDLAQQDELDLPEEDKPFISKLKTLGTANGYGMTAPTHNVSSRY